MKRWGALSLLLVLTLMAACGEIAGLDPWSPEVANDGGADATRESGGDSTTGSTDGADASGDAGIDRTDATRDAADAAGDADADAANDASDAADAALSDSSAADANGVVALAAGVAAMCALHGDGRVACWGHDDHDQLGRQADASTILPPALVRSADGGIYGAAVEIGMGETHACVRTVSGTIDCWGGKGDCQTGTGSGNCSEPLAHPTPVRVQGGVLSGATALAVGWEHSCAVVQSGQVYCWGQNFEAEITSSPASSNVSPAIPVLAPANPQLALGDDFSCALADGGVSCWGWDEQGQCGVAPPTGGCIAAGNSCVGTPSPVSGLGPGVTRISAGGAHACALKDKRVWCWGSNRCGQLGHGEDGGALPAFCDFGSPDTANAPARASALPDVDFVSIAAGVGHTCAVRADDGSVYCFGENVNHQVGNDGPAPAPVLIGGNVTTPLVGVAQVAAGDTATCARTQDGRVYCWGESNGLSDPNASSLGSAAAIEIAVP